MSDLNHIEEYRLVLEPEEPVDQLVASGGLCAPSGTWIYPELTGGFVAARGGIRFDGGTLDLGLMRDSGVSRENGYEIFLENFEGSQESLE